MDFSAASNHRHILIVDDIAVNAALLTEVLVNGGYIAHTALNAQQAFEQLKTHPIALILLDIRMPDIDGYKLCQRIKAQPAYAEIPIIFVSALDDVVDKLRAFEVGGIDYISKPIQPPEVLARIDTHLRLRRLRQQLQQEVRDRKQAEARTQALLEMVQAVSLAPDLNHALKTALQHICKWLEFGYGSVWLPTDNQRSLVHSAVWHCHGSLCVTHGDRIAQSLAYLQPLALQRNEALEGRVWHEGIAAWATIDPPTDVSDRPFDWLSELGYCHKFAIPITRSSDATPHTVEVLAVMVFYGCPQPDEEHRLQQVVALACQLRSSLEQKHTQDALARSEERWQLVLDGNRDGIWDWNTRTDQVLFSDRFAEILGYGSRHDLSSKDDWWRRIHPADIDRVQRITQAYLRGQIANYVVECRIQCKDGHYKWVLMQGKAQWGSNGHPLRMVGSMRDIDNVKFAEEALAQQLNHALLIRQVTDEIRWKLDSSKIFETTVAQVSRMLGVNRCVIHSFREEFEDLPIVAVYAEPGYRLPSNFSIPLHNNPHAAVVLREDRAIASDNVLTDPYLSGLEAIHQRISLKSMLAIRTSYQGYANGVIGVHQCDDFRHWTEEDIHLIEAIAAQVGIALQHAHLLEQEQQQRQLLNQRNLDLQQEIQERKAAQAALKARIDRQNTTQRIIERMRQTLDLEQVFRSTTQELRQIFDCDRVAVYHFNEDWTGEFVAESMSSRCKPLVVAQWSEQMEQEQFQEASCVVKRWSDYSVDNRDTYLYETKGGAYARGTPFLCVRDIYRAGFSDCYIELLEQYEARSYLTVPIFKGDRLWGLLAHYQNVEPRDWQETDIELAVYVSAQLGVAVQQAELLQQTRLQAIALENARDAAQSANRAKSEFLANMSHELRTPLNAILGFSQVLSHDPDLTADNREYLDIINRSGHHLLTLINDVLEMSKIEAGRAQINESSFDLLRLLDGLEDMLSLRASSKDLALTVQRSPLLPQYITSDESKLQQVIINLLGNAIKFTNSGGVILKAYPAPSLEKPTPDSKCVLWFEVSDTGVGIAKNEMNRLFSPFEQTTAGQAHREGTGLGLSISKQFIELMGGQISVSSEVGQGSTFKFYIQARLADAASLPSTSSPKKVIGLQPNQPTCRLLIVDDHDDSRLMLAQLLSPLGFDVAEACNGEEAIAQWQDWQPDAILMDMRMPVMDGYEATRRIKSQTNGQSIPILAVTSSVFDDDRESILETGCDGFIAKPVEEAKLLDELARHLHINYVYGEAYEPTVAGVSLVPDDLAHLPLDWIQQMHRAASGCSDRLVLQLIEALPNSEQSIADGLTKLAYNFRFEDIVALTEPHCPSSHP